MDNFRGYSSIPNLRNAVFDEIQHNNKTILSPTLFRGTVKLHGTHGDIVRFTDGSYHAQSRNKILTDENDNDKFNIFTTSNWEQINILFDRIAIVYKNEIYNHITLAGEWCGQGIQKNVAINNLPRMFVYFDIFIDNRRCDMNLFRHIHNETIRIFNILQFTSYGIIINNFINMSAEEIKAIDEYVDEVDKKCPVAAHFGIDGFGEGIVWRQNQCQGNIVFKTKGKMFFVNQLPKDKKNNNNNKSKNNNNKNENFDIDHMVSQERLHQGIQYLIEEKKEISIYNIKIFIDWVNNNIITEEKEFMSTNDITTVCKIFTQYSAKWYKNHVTSMNIQNEHKD